LGLLKDESKRNTKSEAHFIYLDDYWIQPSFIRNPRGEVIADDRIRRVPLKVFKFHVENGWALLVRADDKLFAEDDVAPIDDSPRFDPGIIERSRHGVVVHIPVSLEPIRTRANKFRVAWHKLTTQILGYSDQHVRYEGRHLCPKSLGCGIYLRGSASVLGLHVECLRDQADFDARYGAEHPKKIVADTDKRVRIQRGPSEIGSYPTTQNLSADSDIDCEPLASLAWGVNGLGSAIVICLFPRLMHYIAELEKQHLI
jgi:hypothetical protein